MARAATSRGNHINYGVREFGMAAVLNGMALHGGFIPYGGTFLTFSDYSRNAIRMAALMKQRVIHVFTHDSIGLGEDGPTHQSVEHVRAPAADPASSMSGARPTTLETAVAWAESLRRRDGPSALAAVAPGRAVRRRENRACAAIARGGYVLAERPGRVPSSSATGTEVHLALQAQAAAGGTRHCRCASSRCQSSTVFDRQDPAYIDAVLPPELPAVAVEAAHPDFWRKYVGRRGAVVGIASFGESAPAPAYTSTSASPPNAWPARCVRCSPRHDAAGLDRGRACRSKTARTVVAVRAVFKRLPAPEGQERGNDQNVKIMPTAKPVPLRSSVSPVTVLTYFCWSASPNSA